MKKTVTRRSFVAGAAAAPFLAHSWMHAEESRAVAASHKSRLLLVGTQTGAGSKGIYAYRWNAASGSLEQIGLATEAVYPTFLAIAPDGKRVFAVHERDEWEGEKTGAVSSYNFDPSAAKLTRINTVVSKGAAPCHISVDHTGHCLFVANYDGGSAASFRIAEDGKLSQAVSEFHYEGHGPNQARQEAPHAHRVTVTPDNRHLLVNDLGLDRIHVYDLDAASAKLTPHTPPDWSASPGTGPRALRFHPNGKWVYVATEMGCTIDHLAWDAAAGTLTTQQSVSLLAENHKADATGSELVLDRSGRHLYAAVRSDDFVAHLSVDPASGKLALIDRVACGRIPRHISLDPSQKWLLVANQEGDSINVFARNTKTGALRPGAKDFPISRPQCLLFV